MKAAFLLFTVLLPFAILTNGQQISHVQRPGQQSDVNVTGNGNNIKVIQAGVVYNYDLSKAEDENKFIDYLKAIPGISYELNKILKVSNETNNRTKEISEQLNNVLKILAEKTNANGTFDTMKFHEELNNYIEENRQLRIENENLKKQTTNEEFAKVLDEANKKLSEFDNEGYQQLLEDFKENEIKKINKERKDVAASEYLQAKNNTNNYKYNEALKQINEAIETDPDNNNYLFLKSRTLLLLFNYDESITNYLKLISVTHDDTLRSGCLNDIGGIYRAKGDYDKALEYYGKALAINEKIFAPNCPGTATTYNNIGLLYKTKGNYDKALEYYGKALAIEEKILGADNPSTAITYCNIGVVYYSKGDYDKALEYYGKALTTGEKILDINDPVNANNYNNVGGVYYDKGDYDKALEYYGKALAINEKIFGKDNPGTAITYNNIGSVYEAKGNYDKALDYYGKALAINEKTLGGDNPSTATNYNNIGSVYKEKGNNDKALEYYQKALVIDEKILGINDPVTAIDYNNIGLMYKAKGDYDKALEYHIKALATDEKILDKNDPGAAIDYDNIGGVYEAKGNYDTAFEYYGKALKVYENVFGDDNDRTQYMLFLMASISIIKKNNVQSASYLEKVNKTIFEKSVTLSKYGVSYFKKSKYIEAINLYLVSKQLLEKTDTPKTNSFWATIYQNLAKAYCYNGNKDKALPLFEQAMMFCKDIKDEELTEYIRKNYEECKLK